MTIEQAFDQYYKGVAVFTGREKQDPVLAFTDGVDDEGIAAAQECGMGVLDLRNHEKVADAIQEIRNQSGIVAVLGRGSMDKAFGKVSVPDLKTMRDKGLQTVVRLGNGVDMDAQRLFDHGILVQRTPAGNASAVRIWQDLMLESILCPAMYENGHFDTVNPAAVDDREIKKKGRRAKMNWNRQEVLHAVDPEGRFFRSDANPAIDGSDSAYATAEKFRGKKICLIGFGIIGQEVHAYSPAHQYADVWVYDPAAPRGGNENVHYAASKEEALQDADLVRFHLAGESTEVGADELALVKRGAMIQNVARGKNIDPKALFEALESGQISRAGLDVGWVEGAELIPFEDLPADRLQWETSHYAAALRRHSRVLHTNHSAASEKLAQAVNARQGVQLVRDLTRMGVIGHAWNAPPTPFPHRAFLHELEGGRFQLPDQKGRRFVLQHLHDGDVSELTIAVRIAMRGALGDVKSNAVSENTEPFFDRNSRRRNAVYTGVFELPPNTNERDGDLFKQVVFAAQSITDVHGARVYVPDPL